MKKKNMLLFLKFVGITSLMTGLLILIPGCSPVFSELQSARLLGPKNLEITPGFSSVSCSGDGETEHAYNHYGLQLGIGISNKMDFRLRYEYVGSGEEFCDSDIIHIFGFGPKFSISKDRVAFYVPVGFALAEDIEISDTIQVHPTLLLTFPISRNIDINPSAKILIPLKGIGATMYAVNLGAAVSGNLMKWALRPEVGFLFIPDGEGYFFHFSLGFSYFVRRSI